MKTHGLRGKYSPMLNPNTTPEQKASILMLRDRCAARGVGIFELRYSTYIGPNCAAEHGDLCVVADGKIYALVMPSGNVY